MTLLNLSTQNVRLYLEGLRNLWSLTLTGMAGRVITVNSTEDGYSLVGAAGSFDFDFPEDASVVAIEVPDTSVTESTAVILGGVKAGPGRDADEAEMEMVTLTLGAIDPGIGFTVYAHSPTATANGEWTATYMRSANG